MNEYRALINYYKDCFLLVDYFHFNSNVSKAVYTSILPNVKGEVVPITHYGIKDNRRIKSFESNKLRIGFIGSEELFKGLYLLIDVLRAIEKDNKWELFVWGGCKSKHASLPIHYCGKFGTDKIGSVYDNMDVLIVPSVWKETFSLVTLEALSYGVPVIVSDNVGAQDIVKEYDEAFVFHSANELKMLLDEIVNDKSKLVAFNKLILDKPWKHDILGHVNEITETMY